MRLTLTILFAAFILSMATSTHAVDMPAKPNIVFILADDLGWADTTLYGHTSFYKTPNIEALAQRGMTFDHAYSASPLCSPTRSSILTGMNPARTGLTTPNCHLPQVVLKARSGADQSTAARAAALKCRANKGQSVCCAPLRVDLLFQF